MRDLTNHNHSRRGGATVGQIADLTPVEAASVLYLRMWGEGENGIRQIEHDFTTSLGINDGQAAFWAFESLCQNCTIYGRRPLMRHQLRCNCLGADESCFANLIGAAGEGAREDAALMASLIVRPDLALPLADLAQQVAIAFQRLIDAAPEVTPKDTTLH
jgi:hypothetical protein